MSGGPRPGGSITDVQLGGASGGTEVIAARSRGDRPKILQEDKVLLNLRNLLDKVGIVFEAHSTWSAATSAGIIAADILKAADWSSELVFTNLGRVLVLCSSGN